MKIYFASDHAGYETKNELLKYVQEELGLDVEDCGAFENDPDDDYPMIIANAAKKLSDDVQAGMDNRAIIGGASGQGEAMVANRFRGVRCALYYGETKHPQTDMSGKRLDILSSTRVHNNANALSLGFRFLNVLEAKHAIKKWLETPFPGEERHARRVKEIDNV